MDRKQEKNKNLLKERLSKQLPGQLLFAKTDHHEPYIVSIASCTESSAFSAVPLFDKKFYLNRAALIIRDEVLCRKSS